MRFGICAPYREVAALETYPFDYLEENVQRFLLPERPQEEFEAFWQEARQLPEPLDPTFASLRGFWTPGQIMWTRCPCLTLSERRYNWYRFRRCLGR